jgi:hypothetical protein
MQIPTAEDPSAVGIGKAGSPKPDGPRRRLNSGLGEQAKTRLGNLFRATWLSVA